MRSSSATTMPFDERVVDRVLLGLHVGGHRSLRALGRGTVVHHRGVGQQIDDAAEVSLLSDRELERSDAGAEAVLELVERALERRALPVELVDEDHARDAALLGHLPGDLGLHLDALDRRDDAHHEVDGAQRRGDVTDEVRVAGGVDEVDLVPVDLERRRARATPRSGGAPPRGRSRRRCCRPRPDRSAGSLRPRTAAPRPASSCRHRRGRRAPRCGFSRSETSSPTTPAPWPTHWPRSVVGAAILRSRSAKDTRGSRPAGAGAAHDEGGGPERPGRRR